MSRRSVQSAALLTIIILVALFAFGCGSGDEETTTTTLVVPVTTLPTSSGGSSPLVGTVVNSTESTPQELVDAIAQVKPVVILFYVPGTIDDMKVLESVEALQSSYPDYVFLLYDHKSPEAYGDLSTLLEVDYPPQLVLIDGMGTVKDVWNGFVDEGTINQSLADLGGG